MPAVNYFVREVNVVMIIDYVVMVPLLCHSIGQLLGIIVEWSKISITYYFFFMVYRSKEHK